MRKIVYIDMDSVLVDFESGITRLDERTQAEYAGRLDEVPGIFEKMDPIPGAIAAMHELATQYDLYVLCTAPWLNPSAWTDKLNWVQRHFGKDESSLFYKRLIISHHKNMNYGHYLIDDRPKNGAKDFKGEWIHFGSELFPEWDSVVRYLNERDE